MTRAAPSGWRTRESYSDDSDRYQMACGHYQDRGVYACNDCNLAPLSDLCQLHRALSDLVDACKRDTSTGRRLAVQRAEMVLEQLD